MLIGEHRHNLDPKKRLSIPAKFRKELGDGAVITRGLESCLFMFPLKQWNLFAEKLANLPMGPQDNRAFGRFLLSGAHEAEFDSLGRILIPEPLKAHAGLQKEVVVAGLYTRLEIWDAKKWEEYKAKLERSSDAIAEKLGEMGVI